MQEAEEGQAQVGLFNVEEYETNPPPSDEVYQEVALNAIGKIALQDLINDVVSALVEFYKAQPDIFQLDVDNSENYYPSTSVMDLVSYLKEVRHETGTSNGAD